MMSSEFKQKLKTSRRVKLLILLIMIALIVVMFPKGESLESDVTIGSVWIQDDLIASTTFEILKEPEVYNREIAQAEDGVYPVFVKNNDIRVIALDSLNKYRTRLRNILDEDLLSDDQNLVSSTFLTPQAYEILKQLRRTQTLNPSQADKTLRDVFDYSERTVNRIYNTGLLDKNFGDIGKDSISLREGKFERLIPKVEFFDPTTVRSFISNNVRTAFSRDNDLNSAVTEVIYNYIRPNIFFSEALTEEAMQAAVDKVPRNIGIVNENERIIAKHDRITPEIKRIIDSYRVAKGEERGVWSRVAQNFGKVLHIIMILTPFIIYIYLFRKRIFGDNVKILLISIIILFISTLAFLVYQVAVQAPMEFLILVPVASMMLTIMFDSRVGFYATVTIALIVGGLRGNDYVFAVMSIVAGGLSAYTVRDIKNRTQIFRSFLYILIGYVVSIVAFGLERFDSVDQMLINSAFAASNALVSPVLTYGLIIFFERIFRITTELTLLELTDFNNPLLKELSTRAPGTFSHSMTIGSLVENAAQEIGANPILARVGAYYHDIGKIAEPTNFVENQLDDKNIHEKMKPEKSAQSIINHVVGGIELAKKHRLPQEVIDFIPMHHGTMVVSFFYEKAKEEKGEENVNIDDYRYPGPKPNTKETALLMLADACESTVRAMTEPEVKKVENVINNLFKQRIDDGQLDEAPITYNDIKKIKESFLKILLVQHHKRIRYPKQEEMEQETKND